MNPTRLSRIAIHKKQERMNLKQGIPSLGELEEDVPVLRRTEDGLFHLLKVEMFCIKMYMKSLKGDWIKN